MNHFLSTACTVGLLALGMAISANALEVTSNNEIRKLNSGLEQRLETTKNALTTAFNGLKATIDDILARLAALEAKVGDVTTKQPVAWNTPLENRLKSIEAKDASQDTTINNHTTRITALEGKDTGNLKVTYSSIFEATKKQTKSLGTWTYCGLSGFSSAEENHSCRVKRSGSTWTLEGNAFNEGSTFCYAICMKIE